MREEEQEQALLATPTQFRRWLLRNKAVSVGSVGSKEACPLANWLNEYTNRADYQVGRDYYGFEGRTMRLPLWAWQFVTLLDLENDGCIRGKDALEILEGVSAD